MTNPIPEPKKENDTEIHPIFKNSKWIGNHYWGSLQPINSVVGDLRVNDDGTLTYALIGYGIIYPDGWEDHDKTETARYRSNSYLPNWLLKLCEKK